MPSSSRLVVFSRTSEIVPIVRPAPRMECVVARLVLQLCRMRRRVEQHILPGNKRNKIQAGMCLFFVVVVVITLVFFQDSKGKARIHVGAFLMVLVSVFISALMSIASMCAHSYGTLKILGRLPR